MTTSKSRREFIGSIGAALVSGLATEAGASSSTSSNVRGRQQLRPFGFVIHGGAGTYADNQSCAVSCTGDGEYFIRSVVAHDISARMLYGGKSLKEAAEAAVEKVGRLGGGGGLVAIDREGNIAMPFNTAGMYRGFVGPDGRPNVQIYKD